MRLVHELGGCEKAKQLAHEYLIKAKENLAFIQDKELETFLDKAADFILQRVN